MVGRRSTGDPPQADYRSVSRATHEFGGSYESECRPEGPYEALKQVPEGPYEARLSLHVRSDPPNVFGGSYESECRPEGPYGALKQVPEGPYGALKKDAQFGKRHSKWVGPKAVPRIVFHFPNYTPFIRQRVRSITAIGGVGGGHESTRIRTLSVKA